MMFHGCRVPQVAPDHAASEYARDVEGGVAMKSTLSKLPGEDDYIVMTDEQGEIHVTPDHASPIVAHAYLGDVFHVRGVQNQWYEIQLLSWAHWYIHRSHARKKRTYKLTLPASVDVRYTIFNAIVEAEARAHQEAAHAPLWVTTPVGNGLGSEDVAPMDDDLLEDRYLLEAIHAFGIHLPEVDEIAAEGFARGWDVRHRSVA
jgi:hypothetical protein